MIDTLYYYEIGPFGKQTYIVLCSSVVFVCFQIAGEVGHGHQNDEDIVLFQGAV